MTLNLAPRRSRSTPLKAMTPGRFAVGLALASAICLSACARSQAGEARAVTRARTQAENAIVIQAVEPQSLVFRGERVTFRQGRPIVCGEFNGRNRRGEFAGFTRFF